MVVASIRLRPIRLALSLRPASPACVLAGLDGSTLVGPAYVLAVVRPSVSIRPISPIAKGKAVRLDTSPIRLVADAKAGQVDAPIAAAGLRPEIEVAVRL